MRTDPRPRSVSPTAPRVLGTASLLLLTAATGVVDAVSYISLDRVFTGNMTGNVLFLGFATMGVDDIPFLNNLVALAGFLVGAVVGARAVPRGRPEVLPRRTVAVVGVVAVGAVALGAGWLAAGELALPAQLAATAFLAVLMGAQVTAVKPLGNTDITTVVVTSTLINLARDSRLAGAPRAATPVWVDRVLAVATMGAGAALGALVIRVSSGPVALGVAAGLILLSVVALAATRRAERAVSVRA